MNENKIINFTDTQTGWQRASICLPSRERAAFRFPADSGRLFANVAGFLRALWEAAG
jgi:hypothetical protein